MWLLRYHGYLARLLFHLSVERLHCFKFMQRSILRRRENVKNYFRGLRYGYVDFFIVMETIFLFSYKISSYK